MKPMMLSMNEVLDMIRDMLESQQQAKSARLLDEHGIPINKILRDRFLNARSALDVMSASKWRMMEPLRCDTCNGPAIWQHPKGGQRCDQCPRPEY